MADTGDPTIHVEVTDDDEMYCFKLTFKEPSGDIVVRLHARSCVDLQHKLALAYLDWQGEALSEVLAHMMRRDQ